MLSLSHGEVQIQSAASASACPPGLPGGIADWFADRPQAQIARDVAQVLEFALVFAPSDLVVVALGSGGTVSAHPVKVALQFLYEAALTTEQIALSFAFARERTYFINLECETSAHRELLRTHDEEIQAMALRHDADIKARLDAIGRQLANVEAKEDTTLQYLITPQGRREGFPNK